MGINRELAIIVFIVLVLMPLSVSFAEQPHPATVADEVRIEPDYSSIVIPPNIGPMNFTIAEKADKYHVKIYSAQGAPIEITSKNGKIKIPAKKWKQLVSANAGGKLFIDIRLLKEGDWTKAVTITNDIVTEKIDAFVAYRMMNPVYNFIKETFITQYDLENLKADVIYNNEKKGNCANCHSFANNDPDKMFMGVRGGDGGSGTIMVEGQTAQKIDTKFGHTAWHPSGKAAAYSIYNVKQFFHASRREPRDGIELDSAILYYLIDDNKIKTIDELSDKKELETQPTWSPDGKSLYFSSAVKPWPDDGKLPPDNFDKVKYSIKKIDYDIATDTWGKLETVLSSEKIGKSMLFPKVTPNGKYLIFVMCNYSCFSAFQREADLWAMEIATGKYHSLDGANSDESESWHSISSNSRWMIYSSKRNDGTFTKLCVSYLDKDGKASKGFLIPQKDPGFYDTFSKCYNVPEFITGPVTVSQAEMERAVTGAEKIEVVSPITAATPAKGAGEESYQQALD